MRNIGKWSVAVAVACLIAGSWFLGPALSQVTLPYPVATGFTSSAAGGSQAIIAANPTRRSIQICNPSAVVWWIAPSPITPASAGAGSYGLPAASSGTTVCFVPPTGVVGSAGNAWNGLPASTPATLTIYEW